MTSTDTKDCFVSWRTFRAIGLVIIILGGALLSVSWGSTLLEQKRVREVDKRQDEAIVGVQLNNATQGEQLSNIEKTVGELKKGQREILKRLPVQ